MLIVYCGGGGCGGGSSGCDDLSSVYMCSALLVIITFLDL